MAEELKRSPYRRHKDNDDLEVGGSGFEDDEVLGPFDMVRTKSAPVDRLKTWRAAYLFQAAGAQVNVGAPKLPPTAVPPGCAPSGPQQLTSMTRDHDFSALQNYGGVKGLAGNLKTSPDKGIHGDGADILQRKNDYGSNMYLKKKG